MIGAPDLLVAVPSAARPTRAARIRRATAAALTVAASLLGGTTVLALVGPPVPAAPAVPAAPDAPEATESRVPAPTGVASAVASPSELLAAALASPWRLIELTLRPEGHAGAVVATRFEAPRGRPARPEQLVASLAVPALTDLTPVAIVATAEGTAVDLAGRLTVDTRRRPGAAVPTSLLAGRVAQDVTAAGGAVRGVRTVRLDGGGVAASVAFDAAPAVAATVLSALEDGVSAPARMTGLLVRRVEDVLAVELTLTPRDVPTTVP